MANYKLLIPHMLKWEGGYSSDPTDTARSVATSKMLNGNPIHTNDGVTFATWINTSKALGHPNTEQAFLNMTPDQWGKIMKRFYWDAVLGDKIESQGIAELLTEIIWGSGPGGLKPNVILLQQFLAKKGFSPGSIDGDMGMKTVTALNNFTKKNGAKGEKELIDVIWKNRSKQLASYKTASKHLKGWMNRMNDWYSSASDRIKKFIEDNPTGSGILGSTVIVFGLFLLGKKFLK